MAKSKPSSAKFGRTTIARCSCLNEYQDAKYGRGNRVFNVMKSPGKTRCSVCEREAINA